MTAIRRPRQFTLVPTNGRLQRNHVIPIRRGEGPESTQLSRSFSPPATAGLGQFERFTPSELSDRNGFVNETFAGMGVTDGSAPTADVCDKGVFWKSPLRPRTMLSLKKAGIFSCATRPG